MVHVVCNVVSKLKIWSNETLIVVVVVVVSYVVSVFNL